MWQDMLKQFVTPDPGAQNPPDLSQVYPPIPGTKIPDLGVDEGAYFPDETPQTPDILGPDPPLPPRGFAAPSPEEQHKFTPDDEEMMEPGEREPSQIMRDRLHPPEREASRSRGKFAQANTGTMTDASPPAIDLPQVDVTPEQPGQQPATQVGPDAPGRPDYSGQVAEQKGWMKMLGDMVNPISSAEAKTPKVEPPANASPEELQQWIQQHPRSTYAREHPVPAVPTAPQSARRVGGSRKVAPGPDPGQEAETAPRAEPKTGWDRMTDPEQGVFPFNYWNTYKGLLGKDVERITSGAKRIGGTLTPEEEKRIAVGEIPRPGAASRIAGGLWDVTSGGLGALGDPIQAAGRSIASQPAENVFGVPKEYTDFALNLGVPILGLPGAPGRAARAAQPGSLANTQAAAQALGVSPPKGGLLKGAQKVLAPETVSPVAEDAASFIREATGTTERTLAQEKAAIKSYLPIEDKMTQNEMLSIQNYIDGGRTAHAPTTSEARAYADTLRNTMQSVRKDYEAMPDHAQQAWRDDYFVHMWKDPDKAKDWLNKRSTGGAGLGSKASLQARTVPTIEEGLRAGLEPKYARPSEASIAYITSMRHALRQEKILQQALDTGNVIKAQSKTMGGSGSGAGMTGIPKGFVQLQGPGGQGKFAPADFARVYNNFVSAGVRANAEASSAYDAARKMSNVTTQSLLGLSGYHAFTMAEAAWSTQMSRALGKARGGKIFSAAKEFAATPFAPITYAYRGKNVKDVYLHPGLTGSKEDKEIVDILSGGGARMVGREHAADYEMSKMGDFFSSLQRGAAGKGAFRQLGTDIAKPYTETMKKRVTDPMARMAMGPGQKMRQAALPLEGTAKAAASGIGRTMQSIQKPLFDHYIPSIKNGANYHLMSDWMKEHPNASHTEKLAASRSIVDMVDARFGEMIGDNIFWNKMLKQTAMLSMLSYSWNMGGIKTIGGGARDISRFVTGQGAWTPKADYLVATTIMWTTLNSMYQYMKTGQAPWQTDTPARDAIAGRTGGKEFHAVPPNVTTKQLNEMGYGSDQIITKRVGNKDQRYVADEERVLPPGIMKDVIGYYNHPMQEAINKLSPALKTIVELGRNVDWKGDPIYGPGDPEKGVIDNMEGWLGNVITHLGGLAPITLQNIYKPQKGMTNLSTPEQLMGVRGAMRPTSDPFYGQWEHLRAEQKWGQSNKRSVRTPERKKKMEEEFKQKYQGPQ